jgi:regulator of sigma D
MLDKSREAMQRWRGVNERLDRWLEERHQLVTLLFDFAAHQDFDSKVPGLSNKVRKFNTLLIDYISAGHFEIYQQLVDEGRENGDNMDVRETARLFEVIDQSTELALAFNEKYEKIADLSGLADELSRLGETLENRFEVEDHMISVLHDAHLQNDK